ncbi:MAG: class I SAM-dependent methyltransferase, partial [Bacteroidales bacterium]|nr:class I SAM-dependent methyltransferase [Bacteroidales bacterium]
SHAAMASWGLDKIAIPKEGRILDIGCGGGANVRRLLSRSGGAQVTGVDYSAVSVAKSSKVNAKAIEEGRCSILEANVASLPFKEGEFALATAFETVYFWPDIVKSFSEVRRVLSEGGLFLIVNEDDGLTGKNVKWEKMIEGMHTYTPAELEKHLLEAGFHDVKVYQDEKHHWLAVSARK